MFMPHFISSATNLALLDRKLLMNGWSMAKELIIQIQHSIELLDLSTALLEYFDLTKL